jgi:hypothetical protein
MGDHDARESAMGEVEDCPVLRDRWKKRDSNRKGEVKEINMIDGRQETIAKGRYQW